MSVEIFMNWYIWWRSSSSNGSSPQCRTSILFSAYCNHPIMKKRFLKMWMKWSWCSVGVVSMPVLNLKVALFTAFLLKNWIKVDVTHASITFQCHLDYQNHWVSETTHMKKSFARWLGLHDKFIIFKTLNWISCHIYCELPMKSEKYLFKKTPYFYALQQTDNHRCHAIYSSSSNLPRIQMT